MPFCNECGARLAPNDPFCGNCGAAQPPPTRSIASSAPPVAAPSEMLPISNTGETTTTAPPAEPFGEDAPETRAITDDAPPANKDDAGPAADKDASNFIATGNTADPIVASNDPAVVNNGDVEAVAQSDASEFAGARRLNEIPFSAGGVAAAHNFDAPNNHTAESSLQSVNAHISPADAVANDGTAGAAETVLNVGAEENPVAGSVNQASQTAAHPGSNPASDANAATVINFGEPAALAQPVSQSNESPHAAPEPPALDFGSEQLDKTFDPEQSVMQRVKSTAELRKEGRAGQATASPGATGGRQPSASKQLETGAVLNGRYEIVRRVGGGGMGAVYLAKDRNLGGAPRAVKEMVESHIDEAQHEKAIGDFKRESLLLTSLEHASIPTIYDYFYEEESGRFYLVMKYISGGDFASRLRNAPGSRLDEKTVTGWSIQVADVLDYLHNRPKQIIYRDLKPANLMIDGNSGRVMLIDFGIARWVNKEDKGVTAVGTMGYAPPELFSGNVEPRSDVYSLGATMFHLLTGSDPQDNPLLIFDFAKNPRPRQISPAISNEMESILMRAVEYKPENRFRSAAEMRDALAAHLERLRAGDVTYGSASATEAGGETLGVEMVFCGFCGGRIASDDVFCAHCGARQPMAVVGASAALRTARATAKLVVAGTTELDGSFTLQKESNLLGRNDPNTNNFPEVDLSNFDPQTKVSRRHARIWRKGETFLIEDLGSVNGTVVLGHDNDIVRLAPHQPRTLANGDKLRLGETTLHFLVG